MRFVRNKIEYSKNISQTIPLLILFADIQISTLIEF